MAETKETLRAHITGVCRDYCLYVWNEALNQVEVDASSTLRRVENSFYPPTLRVAGPSSSYTEVDPEIPEPSPSAATNALPTPTIPRKEVKQIGAVEKDKELAKPP